MSPPSVIREDADHAANSDVQEFAVLTVAVDLQGHIFYAPKFLASRILKSVQMLMHSFHLLYKTFKHIYCSSSNS